MFDERRELLGGFTVVELLAGVVIVAVLASLLTPAAIKGLRVAKRTESLGNLRFYVQADGMYFSDRGEFPVPDTSVPSSISRERLEIIAGYCRLPIPAGPVTSWPKRKQQPKWINCPLARDSGYAEGVTLGGGLYTGYVYVGGIEDSGMISSGHAKLLHPEHAANRKNTRRGVLWASVLAEFNIRDARRYECFHYNTLFAYKDFRFNAAELEGIHRAWSDGSVEWLPARSIDLAKGSADLQIAHLLGNFYY